MVPAQPRVVIVSHLCPFPAVHGNRTRFAALLQWLRDAGFSVTFILQPVDVDDGRGLAELGRIVNRLEVVPRDHLRTRSLKAAGRLSRRLGRAILPRGVIELARRLREGGGPELADARQPRANGASEPGHIDRWCWDTTCQAVQRAVRREHPVAVISEYALLSRSLEGLPAGVLKVIDTVEVFFRNAERFRVEGLAAPFICTPESERTALQRADVIVAIQKNDARSLTEAAPGARIVTVAHAYRQTPRREEQIRPGTVLYVGSSNPFNVHGLQEFVALAWASIRAASLGATLRIVGSVPPVVGAGTQGIIHVGRVSDQQLAEEYGSAHVVINPQVAGTGLKIKCVEALTAGCPLVTNPAGADGLEEGAGSAYLLAQNWPEFSAHVVRLLGDADLRRRVEREAARLASRLFSPEAVFAELGAILQPGDRPAADFRGATAG